VTVVARWPGPPLGGLVSAITYQAGEQSRASVEKILPGPGASLWVNLNHDEFRSFGDAGRVVRVPGAMLAGPTGRASVIEFEQGRAHVSVAFTLGAAACFFAQPLEWARTSSYRWRTCGADRARSCGNGCSRRRRGTCWR